MDDCRLDDHTYFDFFKRGMQLYAERSSDQVYKLLL